MLDVNADDTILMLSYEAHFHPDRFFYKVAKDSIRLNLFTLLCPVFWSSGKFTVSGI